MFRPRAESAARRDKPSWNMALGTRALLLGVGSLALSWVPLLNIVACVAALMAVAFGLLARWPTGWLASEETAPTRGLWGAATGAVALVVFVVTAVRYSAI